MEKGEMLTGSVGRINDQYTTVIQALVVDMDVGWHEPGHEGFVLEHRPISRDSCICRGLGLPITIPSHQMHVLKGLVRYTASDLLE